MNGMNDSLYVALVILVMAAVTFGLRALPFVAARFLTRHPIIRALGQFLPPAIMVLLLLHSLNGLAAQSGGRFWPELLAALIVLVVHWFFKQALLSIVAGIASYMWLLSFHV